MSNPTDGVRLSTRLLTGPISWMARNSVASNLLMIVVFMLGLVGISSIKQEVFPDFQLDMVTVSVPYPGASPEEVEQGIVLAVEVPEHSPDEEVRCHLDRLTGDVRVRGLREEGGAHSEHEGRHRPEPNHEAP